MDKAEYWQQHIAAWKQSGLSKARYCKQHNISQSALYHWRKKLDIHENAPKKLIPVTINHCTPAPVRVLLNSQVVIELSTDNLPDLLLTLQKRGLLNAST